MEQNQEVLAEHFAEFYSNIYSSQTNIYREINDLGTINDQTENAYNLLFTLEELRTSIKDLKSSAPGLDDVHNDMLSNLPREALGALLALYNYVWCTGDFPNAWKKSIIIPILKTGKNKLHPSSYRPISLTSCICKLMEKMIFKRLTWILEENNFISEAQSGFRTGRSTLDHLVTMEHIILDSFSEKKECIGVFFDIEKAYDNLNPSLVLQQLKEWGFRGRLLVFIGNFLRDRTFHVRIGNCLSSVKQMNNGIPQGSVLSCALFAIAINKVTNMIPEPVRPFLFVDDLALLLPFTSENIMKETVQSCLVNLESWSTQSGLNFSIEKTKCLLFSKLRTPTSPPELTYKGTRLNFEPKVKFLGLIVNCKLDWKDHIRWLKEESQKRLNILKVLAGCSWGADRSSMLKVYTCLVRAKLDYGSFVYSSASSKLLSTLDSVHHAGIRLATGAFRTSPVNSLCVEAGLAPLAVRRRQLACGYIARLKFNARNPAWKHIFQPNVRRYAENQRLPSPLGIRLRRYIEEISSLPMATNQHTFPPWTLQLPTIDLTLSKSKKTDTSNYAYRLEYQKIMDRYNNSTHIYTDGSKTNNNVGCSAIIDSCKIKYKLPGITSNFTAETFAIGVALNHIVQSKEENFLLFTDSLSAIKSLSTLYTKDDVIKTAQFTSTLIKNQNKNVVVVWIPSHIGIKGNEEADRAAKEAASSALETRDVYTYSDVSTYLKSQAYMMWTELWEATEGNKLKAIKQDLKSWKTSYRGNRREEVVLTRLRIGHSRLTHGYLIERMTAPICRTCNVQVTIKHIVEECPVYNQYFLSLNIERKLHILLGDNEDSIKTIIKFIKKIKLFNKI